MTISFEGRVAVVTGAGGGLGRTYAVDMARRGARVVVNDLGGDISGTGSGSAAQAVVDEIREAGGDAVASTESVATPVGGEAIVQTALNAYGRLDVVISNAGILRDRSLAKMDWDDFEAVLSTHLRGAFFVAKPAFNAMKSNGYGRFVFTASNSGVFGNFGQSAYGAAKTGLVGLSNVLSIEGGRSGILSNVIMPMAATRMTAATLDHDPSGLAGALDPELVTPMVVYLASEACTLTHEVFSAGAGRYSRVFTGLAPGWYAGPDARPAAEDILEHLDDIEEQDGYAVPLSNQDEVGVLLERMQDGPAVVR